MCRLIKQYVFGDMSASYILNDHKRAVLILLPENTECELFSEKNIAVFNYSSLVHLQLSNHNAGMLSNSFKFSESLSKLQFKEQCCREDEESITVVTVEESQEGYGIRHFLTYYNGEQGFEIKTEFYNNSGNDLILEYISSASLDGLSPCLEHQGGKSLLFHRFKAGWSMEGLHQVNTLTELGLERAWNCSAESLKLGAVGSRPVREYHPYAALEDTENNVIWGVYLAHNASWEMEITRLLDGVSLSIGLADSITGLWSKRVANGECFTTPKATVSVAKGSIAELSNRLLSMRHRAIDLYGEPDMSIAYNEWATSWGNPNEKDLLNMADLLRRGKTKYIVMDDGWFEPKGNGDWVVNDKSFPRGIKAYCDEIRKKGMIPGVWMEFEDTDAPAKANEASFDYMKLKKNGRVIVGEVINGSHRKFWDFCNPKVIEYLDERIIDFLRDNGFGYIKIDYNASIGAGVDGADSPGENLRLQMEKVRDFFIKMKREIPDLVIENCASGGCRLEPSMMDISAMSSASDAHEGYEGAVVAANLHYLTPPRQNQIWCTLKPEYTADRFSHIISQGFLGRICWSGQIGSLSEEQLNQMFDAERFYEKVSPIIKRGNSYIYRTDICSFYTPTGTQAVVRYSEDSKAALVVVHSFMEAKELHIELKDKYIVKESLYKNECRIDEDKLTIAPESDFTGNVYYLEKIFN